jgi:predicted nucleic acid-binding protein
VRILFDTNVVLDVLMVRQPFFRDAQQLLSRVDLKQLTGLLGATSVSTIFYLAETAVGAAAARRHVRKLLSMFEVAPVDGGVLSDALGLAFPDYEDAVLHEAARNAAAAGIVTRDKKGFARATLPVYRPDELLNMLRILPRS